MSNNKERGFQEVNCEKDRYIFKGDFSFLAKLESEVGDLMEAYESIAEGKCDLTIIKSIMICGLFKKNGVEVSDKETETEDLIVRNGIQECHILCQHLLSYAVIGDVKKSQLLKLKPNKLTQMITEPFLLESSRNRRLLWAYHLVSSGICVCISFSLYALLIA